MHRGLVQINTLWIWCLVKHFLMLFWTLIFILAFFVMFLIVFDRIECFLINRLIFNLCFFCHFQLVFLLVMPYFLLFRLVTLLYWMLIIEIVVCLDAQFDYFFIDYFVIDYFVIEYFVNDQQELLRPPYRSCLNLIKAHLIVVAVDFGFEFVGFID